MNFRLGMVVGLAFLSGCAARRIPGTDIDDTSESRAILAVMQNYRQAMEAEDPDRVLSLVTESFKDDGGTASPADDLDYRRLREVLPQRFAKIEDLRLEMTVKKLTVEDDRAAAVYSYGTSYRIPSLTGKTQNESGIKQMVLAKVGDDWKIVSGI